MTKKAIHAVNLAKHGFVVVVVNQWIKLFFLLDLNAANPFDVGRVIDYMTLPQQQMAYQVNVDNTVVMGHSFGATVALFAASETCVFPFCRRSLWDWLLFRQGAVVPMPPQVKIIGMYGGHVFAFPFGFTIPYLFLKNEVPSNGKIVPLFAMYGEGDKYAVKESWFGLSRIDITYEQLKAPRLSVVFYCTIG